MTVGIGSRTSPIIIDDDDDDDDDIRCLSPPRAKVNQNSSTSLTKTPPRETIIIADTVEARDPAPENPNQLRSGIGYSILVRMGYKPGHGLGVNLEGVTSPVKASVRPQKFSTGLGASNSLSFRNRSRNSPNARPATASFPSLSKRANASSLSLPSNATTSSEHSSNQEPRLGLLPEKVSVPPDIDPGSTNGPKSVHADGTCKVNIAKTPLSTTKHLSDSSYPITSPKELGITHPLDTGVAPVSASVPPPSLSLPPRPLSVDPRASALFNPPWINAHSTLINPPPHPPLSPTSVIPYIRKRKGKPVVLGMPVDDAKARGTRGCFFKDIEPPPNPACSVVMETLPRKFRTLSFVLDWLSQFAFQPTRYELVEGKVFFEFKTERDARLAWNSPQMGGLDGLSSVRLYWYRILPQPPWELTDNALNVNAKGTIEDSAQPQLHAVSHPLTDDLGPEDRLELKGGLFQSHVPSHKSALPPLPPFPPTINVENPGVLVDPPAKDIRSNSDIQTSRGTSSSSGIPSAPSPTTTTTFAATTKLTDFPDNRMAADSTMITDLPPGGVPCFIPGATVEPTSVSTPLPTTSSSSSAPTSSTNLPTFSAKGLDSFDTTTRVDQRPPIAQNQELMDASQLAAEISHLIAEVEQTELEKGYRTHPETDNRMEIMDDEALAKEQALRDMVLQSRKRKLLQPDNQQPTSATTSTTTSRSAIEQLTVKFTPDIVARPPPPKRLKVTPSPSAMAAWGKRLEQHVESSKAIMARIHSTQSRVERNRLMEILREKDRRIDKEKMTLFTRPVDDGVVTVSPWPDYDPDQGILELSDTDDGDDYDSDDEME